MFGYKYPAIRVPIPMAQIKVQHLQTKISSLQKIQKENANTHKSCYDPTSSVIDWRFFFFREKAQ